MSANNEIEIEIHVTAPQQAEAHKVTAALHALVVQGVEALFGRGGEVRIHLNKHGEPVENRLPEGLTEALSDTEDQRVLIEALNQYADGLSQAGPWWNERNENQLRSDIERAHRLARLIGLVELPEEAA